MMESKEVTTQRKRRVTKGLLNQLSTTPTVEDLLSIVPDIIDVMLSCEHFEPTADWKKKTGDFLANQIFRSYALGRKHEIDRIESGRFQSILKEKHDNTN
jgi:hypothetical protein